MAVSYQGGNKKNYSWMWSVYGRIAVIAQPRWQWLAYCRQPLGRVLAADQRLIPPAILRGELSAVRQHS